MHLIRSAQIALRIRFAYSISVLPQRIKNNITKSVIIVFVNFIFAKYSVSMRIVE